VDFGSSFAVLNVVYAVFTGLLLIAAATDVARFIIPNWVSAALIVLFVALGIYLGQGFGWWGLHLGAGVLLLVIGYAAWMLRFFGAGDVKLLAVVGLYSGVGQVHFMLLYIALAGGILALFLIGLRRLIWYGTLALKIDPTRIANLPKILVQREQVPYVVAIAAGAIWAGYQLLPGLKILS
jgi:prepilin peptidase CpaA